MIRCDVNQGRGSITVLGENIPNGTVSVTRNQDGVTPYLLRSGTFALTTGGFTREDSEAPFGVPVRYDLEATPTDRVVQRNLVLTPNFNHDTTNWVAGSTRTKTLHPADTPGKFFGGFSGASGGTEPPLPVLVGSAVPTIPVGDNYTSYTLTLPTTGGDRPLALDWMLLVHYQLPDANGVYTEPVMPAGFTKIAESTVDTAPQASTLMLPAPTLLPSPNLTPQNNFVKAVMSVWRGVYIPGPTHTSYTISFPLHTMGIGTALWVRGASVVNYLPLVSPVTTIQSTSGQSVGSSFEIAGMIAARSGLVVTVAASHHPESIDNPADIMVSGVASQYTVSASDSDTVVNNRAITIGISPLTNAGNIPKTSVSYPVAFTSGSGVQIAFQIEQALTLRSIATTKATALPASTKPYRLTGRFRYNTTDIWLWQDVKNQGTWQHLKDTKATWADVRSTAFGGSGDYLRLFVRLMDPATNIGYTPPVLVLTAATGQANQWVDFSFYFTAPVDIPATAVIQMFHGSSIREYGVTWEFDQFGITSPGDLAKHNVYYFDGDSKPPEQPEDYYFSADTPLDAWSSRASDSSMSWAGTAGNSVSIFTGPSRILNSTTCQVDPRLTKTICEPVHLSDPISPQRSQWFTLLEISPIAYGSRQQLLTVINRPDVIAVSQKRAWPSGTLKVKTDTLAERQIALQIFETGRILFLRNPDPRYPETSWYIAVADVTETRILPDQRLAPRSWEIPFVRVERPSGLIDSASGVTWQDIKDKGLTWNDVRTTYPNWLAVLSD